MQAAYKIKKQKPVTKADKSKVKKKDIKITAGRRNRRNAVYTVKSDKKRHISFCRLEKGRKSSKLLKEDFAERAGIIIILI